MNVIFKLIGSLFRRLPFCSLPGAVVGSFAGLIMTLLQLEHPGMPITPQRLVVIGLALGLTGFLMVLFYFGLLLRYGVAQIFWPALANALITSIATAFVTNWLQRPLIAGVLGLLIGVAVGALFCWLCRCSPYRPDWTVEGTAHGQT